MMAGVIDSIHLDHVAVAMEDRTLGWPRYVRDLPGDWLGGGGTAGFWSEQVQYANGMKVELLHPDQVEQNDFLRRFLDRNGPGPHHLTFKVADIRTALELADAAGYPPVSVNLENPSWMEAFLHPKSAPGIVVQLAQSAYDDEDWGTPETPDLPAPRTTTKATLERVTHGVASLDVGLRLFTELLGGREVDTGKDDDGTWVELAWPGPGRVRLVEPTSPASPVARWIGDRAGRMLHLAFATADPASVPGARSSGDGTFEIAPEDNLGVRLLLREG